MSPFRSAVNKLRTVQLEGLGMKKHVKFFECLVVVRYCDDKKKRISFLFLCASVQ